MLEDAAGEEVAKIQERKLSRARHDEDRARRRGRDRRKALIGLRDRFKIEVEGGADLNAHGNMLDHEYEIESDGDEVASVSKKWFRVRDIVRCRDRTRPGRRLDPGDHRVRRRDDPRLSWRTSGADSRSRARGRGQSGRLGDEKGSAGRERPGLGGGRQAAASDLKRDLLAAMPSAIAAIPDGMANGVLAGVSPVQGLYASLVGRVAGGLTASTKMMVITTTSAAALTAGSAIAAVPEDRRSDAVVWLTLIAGA